MATILNNKSSAIYEVDKFLGLRQDNKGELMLTNGESPDMCNFRITENYKLTKREGFEVLTASVGEDKPIRGLWFGKIGVQNHCIYFACNGSLYSNSEGVSAPTLIGSLGGDSENAYFFYWNDCLYILNGKDYYRYDGATLATVEGYRPKLKIGVSPNGTGGTDYEEANMLTGKKSCEFISDGVSLTYFLPESGLLTVDFVIINGVYTNNYSSNLVNGTVSLNSPAALGAIVHIGFNKTNANRGVITGNLYGMFYGGANDVALFLWGNSGYSCRRFWSAIANVEYFPVNSYSDIGSRAYPITDIVRQYDRQIIFTRGELYYSYMDSKDLSNISFPVLALNSQIGCESKAMVQIVNNNPVFVSGGLYELVSTNVRDERNVKRISDRIENGLKDYDLTKAVTWDYSQNGEYFICLEGICFVYNYRNDTFYKFSNIFASRFLTVEGVLYFGNFKGELCRFKEELRNDYVDLDKQKKAINAYWQMPFFDFGREYLYKFCSKLWLSIKPQDRTYLTFMYKTEEGKKEQAGLLSYNLATFSHINFADFSFFTAYNPKPFCQRLNAKRFAYLKLMLISDKEDYTATVLSVIIPASFGGKIR